MGRGIIHPLDLSSSGVYTCSVNTNGEASCLSHDCLYDAGPGPCRDFLCALYDRNTAEGRTVRLEKLWSPEPLLHKEIS